MAPLLSSGMWDVVSPYQESSWASDWKTKNLFENAQETVQKKCFFLNFSQIFHIISTHIQKKKINPIVNETLTPVDPSHPQHRRQTTNCHQNGNLKTRQRKSSLSSSSYHTKCGMKTNGKIYFVTGIIITVI